MVIAQIAIVVAIVVAVVTAVVIHLGSGRSRRAVIVLQGGRTLTTIVDTSDSATGAATASARSHIAAIITAVVATTVRLDISATIAVNSSACLR